MTDLELYVSGGIAIVAVVIAALMLRSSRAEAEMKSFSGGPLGLTRRAIVFWLVGIGVGVSAVAISKLME